MRLFSFAAVCYHIRMDELKGKLDALQDNIRQLADRL